MGRATSGMIEEAVATRRHSGSSDALHARALSSGAGWRVLDVLCTCDRHDAVNDEQHSHYSLALVLGGAFEYRSRRGSAQLAPGSILLCKAGDPFRCWHSYGAGDRCFAVQFESEAFEELRADLHPDCRSELPLMVPVARRTAGLFAFAEMLAGNRLEHAGGLETAVGLADRILLAAHQVDEPRAPVPRNSASRILELARWIETDPGADHDVGSLAVRAGLSKFHCIRLFKSVTGLPPYAFIGRARLRNACMEIAGSQRRIIDVALEAGFSDLSTFNHLFKHHFGIAPQALRLKSRASAGQVLFELEEPRRLKS